MKAGALRQRVALQRRAASAPDPITGAVRSEWVDVLTHEPCELVPLSVRELVAAQSMHSGVTARATLRYRSDVQVSAELRLVHLTQVWNIKGVQPDPTFKHHLTLLLEAGLHDG